MWIAFTLREWDLVPNCELMGRDWDVFALVVDFFRVCGFPWPGLQNSDRSVRFSRLVRLLDRCTALSKKVKVMRRMEICVCTKLVVSHECLDRFLQVCVG